MTTPPVSSLKSSSGSKGSNEDCSPPFLSSLEGRASFLRSSWISRLIPDLPLPISWAKGPRPVAGAEDEDADNKMLSLSPFFQYQRQLANNFLGNGRVDVPPSSSSQAPSDIRPAKVLGLVKPVATSSSAQHEARRMGADSAAHRERAKDPAATTTFGDHVQSNKRQSPGCPSEEEEPFSFWNMGRLDERSNYVSSAAPVRALDMAHGRKRALRSYALVSSKYRKRGSED